MSGALTATITAAAAAALLACAGPETSLAHSPGEIALAGTRWQVTEMDGRAVAGQPGYAPITLVFRSDGQFGGHSGCNAYGGTYRLDGDQVMPSPIEATAIGCGEPLASAEARLFEILSSPFRGHLEPAGTLRIADGARTVLRLRPSAAE